MGGGGGKQRYEVKDERGIETGREEKRGDQVSARERREG